MTRKLKLVALPAAIVVAAVGGAGAADGTAAAEPDPANFTTKIDNPWMPLEPGRRLTYRGVKDGEKTRNTFRVTRRTRVIDGVRCVVVSDRLYSKGHLIERTKDYYVQDKHGNVWYFGEDTAELDGNGKVISREGTWHSGVDGARPGLFMPADPHVGEHHRQEYYKGHAEDRYRVLDLDAHIKVPYGNFKHALRTREWTQLEPGVVDNKYYVRGIGEVFEGSVKGPKEIGKLVAVKRP
jgi:hypothetical protein